MTGEQMRITCNKVFSHFEPSRPLYGKIGAQKRMFLGCFEAIFTTMVPKIGDHHHCAKLVSQMVQ